MSRSFFRRNLPPQQLRAIRYAFMGIVAARIVMGLVHEYQRAHAEEAARPHPAQRIVCLAPERGGWAVDLVNLRGVGRVKINGRAVPSDAISPVERIGPIARVHLRDAGHDDALGPAVLIEVYPTANTDDMFGYSFSTYDVMTDARPGPRGKNCSAWARYSSPS